MRTSIVQDVVVVGLRLFISESYVLHRFIQMDIGLLTPVLDCCWIGILWLRENQNGNTLLWVISIIAFEVWAHLLWRLRKIKCVPVGVIKQNICYAWICTLGSAFPGGFDYWQIAFVLSWVQLNSELWLRGLSHLSSEVVTTIAKGYFWFRKM